MATPRKIRCAVETVAPLGRRVYEVALAPECPAPRFRAGQFLHLALDPCDPGGFWPESRVFSIASPPEERGRLTILYSVRGAFTARMEAELAPGREAWVKLPYGDFDFSRAGDDLALVAGGTGISAFAAFLGSLGRPGAAAPRRVRLFHGAQEPRLLAWRERFAAARDRFPGLSLHLFAERPDPGRTDLGAGVEPGALSAARVAAALDAPGTTDFYLSGPPAMLEAFRRDLPAHGADPARIRADAWE